MAETIFTATTASDYNAFAELVRDYVGWSRTRYGHNKWFVDAALSHQSLDAELEALPKSYGPPNGKALLAMSDGPNMWMRRLSQAHGRHLRNEAFVRSRVLSG